MKNLNNCNGKEHQKWNRRSFLQALGFSSLGTMALANSSLTYSNENKLTAALNASESDNILVIIRLFGGNDGLNTIVPLNQYDLYANLRPTLKHEESNLWNLSDDYAMPNHMSSLESMWNEGAMKVVHSVGYENHSQSHFKGTEIWSAGKDDNSTDTGWMGRYFQDVYPDYLETPPDNPTAIQIGSRKNITFDGDDAKYSFSVSSLSGLETILASGLTYEMEGLPDCNHGSKLQYVRGMFNSTYNHADVIYEAYNNSTDYTGGVGYNLADAEDDFAATLSVVSRLIKGNLGTKVYTLTVSGFDTHSAQTDQHQALLTYLSDAVTYFYEDLADAGLSDKVLTMVVSEFGRRVYENGSLGTDHGIAGPIMFFGDGLNGSGFVGEHGSLANEDLYNGRDLQWHTDFKQVYSTVLKEWMCVDATTVDSVVLDSEYESLNLGFACSDTLSTSSFNNQIQAFSSSAYYENGNTYIKLQNNITQHLVISIFDLNGKKIGEVRNSILSAGIHKIDVKSALKTNLSRGYYLYNIGANSKAVSKKIMIM